MVAGSEVADAARGKVEGFIFGSLGPIALTSALHLLCRRARLRLGRFFFFTLLMHVGRLCTISLDSNSSLHHSSSYSHTVEPYTEDSHLDFNATAQKTEDGEDINKLDLPHFDD